MPTSSGRGKQWIETVLTCEGNFDDPDLPQKLTAFNNQLHLILQAEKERLVIKKVEPWNSVKVTLNIPPEFAVRLRALAEEGSQALRNIGVLAVQVEGDQIISLTLAGKNTEQQQLSVAGASADTTSGGPLGENRATGLSQKHCDDRRAVRDEFLHNGTISKSETIPLLTDSPLMSQPASLHCHSLPSKRPRKATGSRTTSSKQALGSIVPGLRAEGTATEAACAAATNVVTPPSTDTTKPKPRCRRKRAANEIPMEWSCKEGAQLMANADGNNRCAQLKSPQAGLSSAARLVSLVENLHQPTSSTMPALQAANGSGSATLENATVSAVNPTSSCIHLTDYGVSFSSAIARGPNESIKAINDIITSLAANVSRGGSISSGEQKLVIATSASMRPTQGSSSRAAPVALSGNGTQNIANQKAYPQSTPASGRVTVPQAIDTPHFSTAAKHLYHPAGEDRHAHDTSVFGKASTPAGAAQRGNAVLSTLSMLNPGSEPSNSRSMPQCNNRPCARNRLGCVAQGALCGQLSSTVNNSPAGVLPSTHSSQVGCSEASAAVRHDDNEGMSFTREMDSDNPTVLCTAGGRVNCESIHDHRAFPNASYVEAHQNGAAHSSTRQYHRSDKTHAVVSLRYCDSPTIVEHLEGTIMSVAGEEGDDSLATPCAGIEERDGMHLVNIGVRQAFPALQTVNYAIPPCLDMAKVAADLQSQESPMSSPAVPAALSKHESASETETESGSAVSVDSGIASSSPKSDLGEPSTGSAANTPGCSEQESHILGAFNRSTDAVGDVANAAMTGRLWELDLASTGTLTMAPTSHVQSGNPGSVGAVLSSAKDVPYRMLPTAWQNNHYSGGGSSGAISVGHAPLGDPHQEVPGGGRLMFFNGTCQDLQGLPTVYRERKRPVNNNK